MNRITTRLIPVIGVLCLLWLSYNVQAEDKTKEPTDKEAETEQEQSPFLQVNKDALFKPVMALEGWFTHTLSETDGETSSPAREDMSFRRFRFGGSGSPYSWLSYSFQLHLDRLGEDDEASTKGSYGGINIWNAYITARLLPKSDLLNLHAGYYWAAISRQYNTSPWAVGGFDKTRACWYMRKFMTGRGNGIESGIGIGGLKNFKKFGISYRLASHEPAAYASSEYASRLYSGRVMFTFGEAEQSRYKYMLSGNQWHSRKGVTLGFGGATQSDGMLSDTLYFSKSASYGADILINYGGLRIDGEYFKMNRQASSLKDFNGTEWHLEAGYSFILHNRYLEPVICYDKYEGEGNATLYSYTGVDKTLDIGLNCYLNKDKLKLALHYLMQDGSLVSNTNDYIGLACQVRL